MSYEDGYRQFAAFCSCGCVGPRYPHPVTALFAFVYLVNRNAGINDSDVPTKYIRTATAPVNVKLYHRSLILK